MGRQRQAGRKGPPYGYETGLYGLPIAAEPEAPCDSEFQKLTIVKKR